MSVFSSSVFLELYLRLHGTRKGAEATQVPGRPPPPSTLAVTHSPGPRGLFDSTRVSTPRKAKLWVGTLVDPRGYSVRREPATADTEQARLSPEA